MKFLEKLLITLFWSLVIAGIGIIVYYVIGLIEKKPDTLVKEDTEYFYYKRYDIYNKDSCVYKFHKPIVYDGEIVNKRSHIQGIPGKGGHWVYRTYIKYNGDKEHIENGMHFYSNHKVGDKVKITVVFYPYEKIYSID